MTDVAAVADAFIVALTTHDVVGFARLFDASAKRWINIGPSEFPLAEFLGMLEREWQLVPGMRLEFHRRLIAEDGFTLLFTSAGSTPDGETFSIPASVTATLNGDGKITRLDEYLNRDDAAPVLRAMFAPTERTTS